MAIKPDVIISAETRLDLIRYELDPKGKDLRMAIIAYDTYYPSDECYLRDDGNYNMTEGAWTTCARQGIILPTIKKEDCVNG